jgi:hypothetical protein
LRASRSLEMVCGGRPDNFDEAAFISEMTANCCRLAVLGGLPTDRAVLLEPGVLIAEAS